VTNPIRLSLRDALDTRRELGRLLVVAALLAISVNLISSEISTLLPEPLPLGRVGVLSHPALWLGLVLLVGCLWYLAQVVFRSRVLGGSFSGFVILNPEDAEIVPVREYELTTELRRALRAVFLENKALEAAWKQHPISRPKPPRPPEPPQPEKPVRGPRDGFIAVVRREVEEDTEEPKAAALLREALEYVVLERLSTHLRDFFEHRSSSKMKLVREYKREDVSSLLLQNRVLNLLCTPIENRIAFADSGNLSSDAGGEVHLIMGPDGQVYSRFDLMLPTDTVISRPEPGLLRLSHKRIVVDIRIAYDGFGANLSREFLAYYVGIDPMLADVRLVRIEVEGRVPRWSLLRSAGWEYYRWFDSFSDRLETLVSRDALLKRINWDALSAHLFVSTRLSSSRGTQRRELGATVSGGVPPQHGESSAPA